MHRLGCAAAARTRSRGGGGAQQKDKAAAVQCRGPSAPSPGFWPLLLEEFTFLVPVLSSEEGGVCK